MHHFQDQNEKAEEEELEELEKNWKRFGLLYSSS